jgi:hypothetical protein
MRFIIPVSILLSALSLPSFSVAADSMPVGRLFSTPSERAALDLLRQKTKLGSELKVTTEAAAADVVVEPVPEQFTLDGFVRRSSGKNTTWINQMPQTEDETSRGIRVRQQISKAPAVSILLPSGKRLRLKAGQTFDQPSGKVSEVYEALPVTIAPKSEH